MMPMINMMLGEVAPGGAGSGLYGLLILAVITVFVAGLMVGRTPEYLGKKIGAREIKFASLYFLITPALVLVGTAAAFATGNNSTALNVGPHGLSEVLYAFTSASNNNGSAFAGITVNTPWWDTALGLCMLLGRFLPIIFVLALAGSLARQQPAPASAGTLPTHRAAVRRHGRRRHGDPRGADLPARARPRPAGRRAVTIMRNEDMTVTSAHRTVPADADPPAPRPPRATGSAAGCSTRSRCSARCPTRCASSTRARCGATR